MNTQNMHDARIRKAVADNERVWQKRWRKAKYSHYASQKQLRNTQRALDAANRVISDLSNQIESMGCELAQLKGVIYAPRVGGE